MSADSSDTTRPPVPPGTPGRPPAPPSPHPQAQGATEPERRAFFNQSAREAAKGALQAAEFLPPVARVFRLLGVEKEPSPSRRAAAPPGGTAPAGGPVRRWPVMTLPPGAVANFYTTCTRCNDCVTACPYWAIRKAGTEFGPVLEGYPLLLPSETACHLCPDTPCITACQPQALMPIPVAAVRLGALAVIDYSACTVPHGKACDVCIQSCPVGAQAIVADVRGWPQVIAPGCTGCGMCVAPCPTGAVRMEPAGNG